MHNTNKYNQGWYHISFNTLIIGAFFILMSQSAHSSLLYSASLKNGDYGGGFIVDTFSYCNDPDGSSCGDGDLSNIGITDTANGVNYTAGNAVINYSLGKDGLGGPRQNTFRTHGTASVSFNANSQNFVSGQPFTDNFGFNQWRSGQGSFGTGLSRNAGADGILNTADDKIQITWSTWHNNIWYNHHTPNVLVDFDKWYDIGFAWGGPTNNFEIWVDGVLMASDSVPSSGAWGSYANGSSNGLGAGYNFALGEIHERPYGNSSAHGLMFADLELWDEYRAYGATSAPQPPPPSGVAEPSVLALLSLGLAGFGYVRRKI